MGISISPQSSPANERLAYSIQEAADLLGVNYFSVYRLIQRGKLKVCRALRGKLLVPRTELLKLLRTESGCYERQSIQRSPSDCPGRASLCRNQTAFLRAPQSVAG